MALRTVCSESIPYAYRKRRLECPSQVPKNQWNNSPQQPGGLDIYQTLGSFAPQNHQVDITSLQPSRLERQFDLLMASLGELKDTSGDCETKTLHIEC